MTNKEKKMARKQTRKSISVTAEHYDMLKDHAGKIGCSMGSMTEIALEKYIGKVPAKKRGSPKPRKDSAHSSSFTW